MVLSSLWIKRAVQAVVAAGSLSIFSMMGVSTSSAITCLNDPNGGTDCNIQLEVGNNGLTGAGYTGPYIGGNIHWVSDGVVDISLFGLSQYRSDTDKWYFYQLGDVWLNLFTSGGTVTASNLLFDPTYATVTYSFYQDPNLPGAANAGGFGEFNVFGDGGNGSPASVDFLSFRLTLTGTADLWERADEVLMLNDEGHSAKGHVYVTECVDENCERTIAQGRDRNLFRADTGVTGYATWPGSTTDIPEPLSLALVGSGLLGMVVLRRRRSRP